MVHQYRTVLNVWSSTKKATNLIKIIDISSYVFVPLNAHMSVWSNELLQGSIKYVRISIQIITLYHGQLHVHTRNGHALSRIRVSHTQSLQRLLYQYYHTYIIIFILYVYIYISLYQSYTHASQRLLLYQYCFIQIIYPCITTHGYIHTGHFFLLRKVSIPFVW